MHPLAIDFCSLSELKKNQKEPDCSLAVGIWNYWDHKHVTMIRNKWVDKKIYLK